MSTTHQMYLCRMSGMQYAAIARRFGLRLEVAYRMIKDFERLCFARLSRAVAVA